MGLPDSPSSLTCSSIRPGADQSSESKCIITSPWASWQHFSRFAPMVARGCLRYRSESCFPAQKRSANAPGNDGSSSSSRITSSRGAYVCAMKHFTAVRASACLPLVGMMAETSILRLSRVWPARASSCRGPCSQDFYRGNDIPESVHCDCSTGEYARTGAGGDGAGSGRRGVERAAVIRDGHRTRGNVARYRDGPEGCDTGGIIGKGDDLGAIAPIESRAVGLDDFSRVVDERCRIGV